MKKIIFILFISINIAYSQNSGYSQMFVIEDPAVLSLKFPLQVGTKWTAKTDSNFNFTILKEVIGRETITINGNDYDCLKVEKTVKYPNEDYISHNWIAEEGLIKRVHYITGSYTDVNGAVIGTYTGTDELILTDIDLK